MASYRGRSLIKKGNINSDDPFVASLTPFLPDDHYYTPGYFQIPMEICCDNLPWKVYNQFGGGVDTSTVAGANLFAIVSVLLVSFLLFFITNLDWGSVIGKRFPWTVEGRISKDDNQMGRLEESDSKGSS